MKIQAETQRWLDVVERSLGWSVTGALSRNIFHLPISVPAVKSDDAMFIRRPLDPWNAERGSKRLAEQMDTWTAGDSLEER